MRYVTVWSAFSVVSIGGDQWCIFRIRIDIVVVILIVAVAQYCALFCKGLD